jgi:DNA recombination-dependent growth factor C
MLWFRNAIVYRFEPTPGFTPEHLSEALSEHPFTPCGSQELSRSGWSAPVSEADEMLVFSSNGFMLINLLQEERILPGSVVREALDERVALIEAEQSRKVYRKEKLQLKDEVILDLLPRSFTRRRRTYAADATAGLAAGGCLLAQARRRSAESAAPGAGITQGTAGANSSAGR